MLAMMGTLKTRPPCHYYYIICNLTFFIHSCFLKHWTNFEMVLRPHTNKKEFWFYVWEIENFRHEINIMPNNCQPTHTIEISEGIKAAAYLWPLAAESKVGISVIKHVGWRDIVIIGNYVLSSSMCPENF